ncbi:MAG: hypothetical protein KA738_12245, partial [Pseudoxanthomonas sp.]|nr:hypothetical protein [Pseudoxanthomonas sp.]
ILLGAQQLQLRLNDPVHMLTAPGDLDPGGEGQPRRIAQEGRVTADRDAGPALQLRLGDLSTAETKPATGRRKTRPVAGIERHGARARQIAGAGHGALARRAKSRLLDQVLGGVFRARLWPSR